VTRRVSRSDYGYAQAVEALGGIDLLVWGISRPRTMIRVCIQPARWCNHCWGVEARTARQEHSPRPADTALPGTPAMMATLLITAPSAARAHGALGALAHIRDAVLHVAHARRQGDARDHASARGDDGGDERACWPWCPARQ
jgi:hypothetical protein